MAIASHTYPLQSEFKQALDFATSSVVLLHIQSRCNTSLLNVFLSGALHLGDFMTDLNLKR
eukprot:scaffold56917_cov23-Tisochrysis_lutea.AAC.1